MEPYIVRIKEIGHLTHDVLKIRTERPDAYSFTPGQATEVAINRDGWREERRPFTFTSLPYEEELEFIIKTYPARKGMTARLGELQTGDELVIGDSWGAIHYNGPGLFIAGGAGLTPFLSIFRHLAKMNGGEKNRLVFANKTQRDILLAEELERLVGTEIIHVLSEESATDCRKGFITENLLKEVLPGYTDNVYVCGPPPMMDAVMQHLAALGVSDRSVIMEI